MATPDASRTGGAQPGGGSASTGAAKGLLALPPGLRSGAGGDAPRDGVQLGLGLVLPKDYVPAAESAHALYQVELASFSGPLDLLLFLIKRHHLNVLDIPMAFVCARYLEALNLLQDYTLDVAAEFMFMASELLHIKSRMLLPRVEPEGGSNEEDLDPRATLVARLLAYQTFKDAADNLHALPQLERDNFARAPEAVTPPEARLREVDAMALVRAFDQVLRRQKPEVRHRVVVEQVPMRLRMHRVLELLAQNVTAPLRFEVVLREVQARVDLIVTFLAILELAKLKLLRIAVDEADQNASLYVMARFATAQEAQQRLAGAHSALGETDEALADGDEYAG